MIYYYHNAYSVRDALVFPLFSVFVWMSENDSNTLRVDTYFLENGWKKSSFSNKNGYVWTWPKFTWERERQGDKFYHLCQNSDAVPSLQLQPKFPPVF